jgi:hypothetical protein
MLEMMRELWGKGYHFVEGSYFGYYAPEDFEEVEDSYKDAETEEYLRFEVEVDHVSRTVTYYVENDE